MNAILLSVVTFFFTCGGGILALRYRNKMHLIMGFAAGVLIGVVAFDLLPELFTLIDATHINKIIVFGALVVGFLFFHLFEKLVLQISKRPEQEMSQHHPALGLVSALTFAGHSLLEGVEIGAGFQISPTVGFVIAIAVILHDIGDGINIMTLLLLNKHSRARAISLLLLVAIAPLLGAASTLFLKIPENQMPLYLGVLTGFLLYIGASHVLPEAHHEKSTIMTLVLCSRNALCPGGGNLHELIIRFAPWPQSVAPNWRSPEWRTTRVRVHPSPARGCPE
ncbi:MAG TPA: ZIP family metal transporter [Ktedonobacteraceae bacterium]|nr:ZIP family metal transporter [Ktedonobacteraceae bacterium]